MDIGNYLIYLSQSGLGSLSSYPAQRRNHQLVEGGQVKMAQTNCEC